MLGAGWDAAGVTCATRTAPPEAGAGCRVAGGRVACCAAFGTAGA
jgi:hypothetical protein